MSGLRGRLKRLLDVLVERDSRPRRVYVVTTPEGEFLPVPGVPTIQITPRGGDPADHWRPPYRRFVAGRDDVDALGRPLEVVRIHAETLASIRVRPSGMTLRCSPYSDLPMVEEALP